MSDPVENVEIEDVLSSIRRLVSADEREGGAPRPLSRDNASAGARASDSQGHEDTDGPRAQAKDKTAEPEKLVLTAALRVDEPNTPETAEAQEGRAETGAETPAQPQDASDWEILEDEAEAVFGGEQDDAEGWDEIEDAEFVDVTEAVSAPSSSVRTARTDEDKPEGKLSEFLRHSDMQGGTAPKRGDEASDKVEDEDVDEAFFDADAPDAWEESLAEDVAEDDAEGEGETGDIDALQSRIEEMSAAFDDLDDPYDPEPGSASANAGSEASDPLPWAEMEAAEAAIAAREGLDREAGSETLDEDSDAEGASANPAARASETPDWLGDDAVIDEEMLRDLVAEIVRQELQGALGERITRNVRKLVRREINRALMSQGIE